MNNTELYKLSDAIRESVNAFVDSDTVVNDLINKVEYDLAIMFGWPTPEEEELEQLKREVVLWREIVADLLDLPPVMLEKPSDARRYARERVR